jgi:hypothetical protein
MTVDLSGVNPSMLHPELRYLVSILSPTSNRSVGSDLTVLYHDHGNRLRFVQKLKVVATNYVFLNP